MVDFAQKYKIENITSFSTSQGSDEMDPFLNGQYSMKVDGPFSVSLIERHKPDLNFGVAPIPTPTGDDFTTWSGGHSLIMPEGSNHPEEAWEFMKFFCRGGRAKDLQRNFW